MSDTSGQFATSPGCLKTLATLREAYPHENHTVEIESLLAAFIKAVTKNKGVMADMKIGCSDESEPSSMLVFAAFKTDDWVTILVCRHSEDKAGFYSHTEITNPDFDQIPSKTLEVLRNILPDLATSFITESETIN